MALRPGLPVVSLEPEVMRGPTYTILELNKRIGRQVQAHPMSILFFNLDSREIASDPGFLDCDVSEPNVIPVHEGKNAGARVTCLQPGTPFEAKGSAAGDIIRVQWLTLMLVLAWHKLAGNLRSMLREALQP